MEVLGEGVWINQLFLLKQYLRFIFINLISFTSYINLCYVLILKRLRGCKELELNKIIVCMNGRKQRGDDKDIKSRYYAI